MRRNESMRKPDLGFALAAALLCIMFAAGLAFGPGFGITGLAPASEQTETSYTIPAEPNSTLNGTVCSNATIIVNETSNATIPAIANETNNPIENNSSLINETQPIQQNEENQPSEPQADETAEPQSNETQTPQQNETAEPEADDAGAGFGAMSEPGQEESGFRIMMLGSGTLVDPYQVTNCTDLQEMNQNVGANYSLMNSINCSNTASWNWNGSLYLGFKPVGNSTEQFKGTFDGRNRTVNNLFINRPSEDDIGLFGYAEDSVIKNVGLENANVTGSWEVGGLVGTNKGVINSSYSTGMVLGYYMVGGLAGKNDQDGLVSNSHSAADVNGEANKIGGLIGFSYIADVEGCYATGNVNGSDDVGGLIGHAAAMGGETISDSFSTGNVTGTGDAGGLIGFNEVETISNCHYNNNSGNPAACVGDDFGTTDCTAVQDNEQYFFDVSNPPMANWSYPPWDSFCDDSGYPPLEWENVTNVAECRGYTPAAPNTPPTQGIPILNSTFGTNYTSENLTVYNQSTYDADSDPVKNIINWYKDGKSITVLNMPFEADGDQNATDYSGFGNNGTAVNATWNSTGGYDGKGAYEFDGSGDYIKLGDVLDMGLSDMSIGAWVKTGKYNMVVAKAWSAPYYYTIVGGTFKAVIHNGASSKEAAGITLVNDSKWHHVFAVYDRDGNLSIYIDGSLENRTDISAYSATSISNTNDLAIGANCDANCAGSGNYFNGSIDEVRIYNYSLSPEQIKALYENRTDLIASQETSVGDVWQACITPNDGYEDGDTNCSNNLTIVEIPTNTPPVMQQVIVISAEGTNLSNSSLVCQANATDADADILTYEVLWYKDGTEQFSLSTAELNGNATAYTGNWAPYLQSSGISADSKGNITIAATENSSAWIGKYYSNMSHIWNKTYKFPDSNVTAAVNVVHDNDDNIVVIGYKYNDSSSSLFIAKFDTNGNELWNVSFDPNSFAGVVSDVWYYNKRLFDVGVDSSNNIVVVGQSPEDLGDPELLAGIVYKFDEDGNHLWNSSFSVPGSPYGDFVFFKGVDFDSQDNIIAGGTQRTESSTFDHDKFLIVKYNSSGTQLWNSTNNPFDYQGWDDKAITGNIVVDSNGDIYITGFMDEYEDVCNPVTEICGPGQDYTGYLAKHNSSGGLLWNRTIDLNPLNPGYNDPHENFYDLDEYIWDIGLDSNGNIYVLGEVEDAGVGDYFNVGLGPRLFKFDPDGNELWSRRETSASALYELALDNRTGRIYMNNLGFAAEYYKEIVENQAQGVLVNVSTLGYSETSYGETWYCEVRAYDGEGWSTYNTSNNLTITSTPISSCGVNITTDSVLNADISQTGSGTCINVNASNIIIDCQGYNLTGDNNGVGINVNGYDGVTIKNCYVKDFYDGVRLNNADGGAVINSILFDNNNYGLYMASSDSNNINNCTFNSTASYDQATGIYMSGADSNIIQNSFFDNELTNAIYLLDSDYNRIQVNDFERRLVNFYGTSNHNNITNNNFDTEGTAIYASGNFDLPYYNRISDNYIKATGDGIYLNAHYFRYTTIENNIINATPGYGIRTISRNHLVNNNLILDTGNHGIYFQAASSNITNNKIVGVTGTEICGIRLEYADNNNVFGNTVNDSYYGIFMYDSESTDLANNRVNNATNGIIVWSFDYQDQFTTSSNDSVDGKYIYQYDGLQDAVIEDLDNISAFWCYNCDNVTLRNANLSGVSSGVLLLSTTNSRFENINITNNDILSGLDVYETRSAGILTISSHNNTFANIKSISQSLDEGGITLRYSDNNTLDNVYTSGWNTGLYLRVSDYNTVKNSRFENYDGYAIYVTGLSSPNEAVWNSVQNSTINITRQYARGISMSSMNSSVLNSKFYGTSTSNPYESITIASASKETVISNNTFYNGKISTDTGVGWCWIENNTFYNAIAWNDNMIELVNWGYGFFIRNNEFHGSTRAAIRLRATDIFSATVENNLINTTFAGAGGYGIWDTSNHGKIIVNNTIVMGGDNGIALFMGPNKVVANNTITGANEAATTAGILIGATSNFVTNSNITGNNITGCSQGIRITNAGNSNNLIYNNYINATYEDAYSVSGASNDWNTTYNCTAGPNIIGGSCIGGNYWSDYTGADDGSGSYPNNYSDDGIGDTLLPHNGTGIVTGGDYLPLVHYVAAANTPPTQGIPILNSTFGTNYTSENITVYNQSTYDADSDPVKNIINWYRDGTSIALLNMPFEGGSLDGNASGVPNGAKDYSGYSNNGTAVNATWNSTGGYDGKGAYEFDGYDNYITVADSNDWDFANKSATISLWVKMSGIQNSTYPNLVHHYQGGGTPLGWQWGLDHILGCKAYFSYIGTNPISLSTTYPVNDSTWHHLAITIDNSTLTATLYVDGVLDKTDTYSNLQDHDKAIEIGGRAGAGGVYSVNGTIDEVMIYNYSLSAEQIKALYENRTDLIVSQETSVGDTWQACITPNDGYEDGDTNCSNNLTIVEAGVSCGDNITSDTTLTSDLNMTGAGNCLTITNDHITLDCAGFNIDGNDATTSYGIWADSRDNITIKNCDITDFTYGVYLKSTNNSIIYNNTANSAYRGIYIESSRDNNITSNTAINNTKDGIRLYYSTSCSLSFNNASFNPSYNSYGIYLYSSSNNTILFNTLNNNGEYGIFIYYFSSNNSIYGNTAKDNGECGIRLDSSSDNNSFTNNTLSGNSQHQIHVSDSNEVRLKDQDVYGNYSFSSAGLVFEDTGEAQLRFLQAITGSGTNLSAAVQLASNLVDVDSATETEFNVSANITVYNTDLLGLSEKVPYRNGAPCPTSICTEIVDDDAYVFNVTGFTNYSVGEGAANAPPAMAQVAISSTSGNNYTTDNLTCWANATDDDGDNLSYSGYWLKNGALNDSINTSPINYTQNTLVNVSTLDSSHTTAGENWSCKVRAYDGEGYSSYLASSNLTVVERPLMCGDTIYSDTVLTADLKNSTGGTICPGNGLIIGANNIMLDCAGHSIIGNGGSYYPVSSDYYNGTIIKNCIVHNWAYGITAWNTDHWFHQYINNTVYNVGDWGILVFGYNNSFINNTIHDSNNDGIYVSNSIGYLDSRGHNLVQGNNISNCGSNGIYVDYPSQNIIKSNTIKNCGVGLNNGISQNNTWEDNYVGNCTRGFYTGDDGSNITGNSFLNNIEGLYFIGAINNIIRNNSMINNTGYGVNSIGSTGNLFYNNFFNNTNNVNDTGTNYWNTTRASGTSIVGGPYIGGNYWADYDGDDNGAGGRTAGDSIGDTEIPYNSSGNIQSGGDYLPLLYPPRCGDVITKDTYLGENLKTQSGGTTCTGHGLVIGANDITLDCQGHSMTGDLSGTDYGILNNGFDNVTIKNCKVYYFRYGIRLESSANKNKIINNTAQNNYYNGIYLSSSHWNKIANNTVKNPGTSWGQDAIYLLNSDYNVLDSNDASNTRQEGIYLSGSSHNNLTNNIANGFVAGYSTDVGIKLEYSSNYNTLINNTANGHNSPLGGVPYGFQLGYNSNHNTFINNTANYNGLYGIRAENSHYNAFISNNFSHNKFRGILLQGSNNTLAGNTITNTSLHYGQSHAIYVHDAYNNTIANNTITNNPQYGVYLESTANNNTIYNNFFNDSVKAYNVIDEFTSSESWTENQMTGGVSGGNYVGAITNTADPYMHRYVTAFQEFYNNLEIRYISYASGPTHIKMYYEDNYDCNGAFSEACSESFAITSDGSWHTLDVKVTDAEWIDDDGSIDRLRFDFDGASLTGTVYLDYIRFYGYNNTAYDTGTNKWNITYNCSAGISNIVGKPCIGGNYWSGYTGKDTTGDYIGDTLVPYTSSGNIQTGGDYLPLVLDSSPTVKLVSPANSSTSSSASVTFTYNVTDDTGLANCSLIIGSTVSQTDYNATNNAQNSFSATLANGDYSWKVRCTDNSTYKNTGASSAYKLTVSVTTGGGGGGGEPPPPPPPECSDECSSGQKRCSGDGIESCGNYDSDSCLEWGGTITPCSLGTTCAGGQCISCNECPSEGALQCSGSFIQECIYSGNCLGWETLEQCPEGCLGGVCTCEDECEDDECSGGNVIKCRDIDFDGCSELDTASPEQCAEGETCSGGNCIFIEVPEEILPPPEEELPPGEEAPPGEIIEEIIEKLEEEPVEYMAPEEGGCTGIITRESTTSLEIEKVPITEAIKVPKGYEIIKEPFSIDCQGDTFILTLNIPSNYLDVKALKCKAGECQREIYTTTEREFACGVEIGRNVTVEEKRYISPEEMALIVSEEKSITEADTLIVSGSNMIEFLKPLPSSLLVSLGSPKSAVPKPVNPSLGIIGTPLVAKITTPATTLGAVVTMPYTLAEGVEEDSIAVYVAGTEKAGWTALESEINKEAKTVSAKIDNIIQHLNKRKEAMFAVIAVKSPYEEASALEKVYHSEGSRDAILLVHGLGSDPSTFDDMVSEFMLNKQPWQIWTFGYSSSRDIDIVAEELAESLESHSMEFDNIYIVAHSLGGLVAQQAMHNSDLNREKFSYIGKVRKAILVATPNKGSPGAEVYKNLYKYLVNFKGKGGIFNVNSEVIDEIAKGRIIPRVKGVEYYVIAGTKAYEFNLGVFKIAAEEIFEFAEKNDGIVTVSSARNIGGEEISDMCKDYWEIGVTHTEIIDVEQSVKVIQQILSDSIAEAHEDKALVGRNQYFKLRVDNCNPEDTYVLIGKRIRQEEVYDELLCGCGNGYCGEGENEYNCPSDCARILTAENILISGPLIVYLLLFATFLVTIAYTTKKYILLLWSGGRWVKAIATMLFISIAATVLYSVNYGVHIILAYASSLFLLVYITVLEIWAKRSGFNEMLKLKKKELEVPKAFRFAAKGLEAAAAGITPAMGKIGVVMIRAAEKISDYAIAPLLNAARYAGKRSYFWKLKARQNFRALAYAIVSPFLYAAGLIKHLVRKSRARQKGIFEPEIEKINWKIKGLNREESGITKIIPTGIVKERMEIEERLKSVKEKLNKRLK